MKAPRLAVVLVMLGLTVTGCANGGGKTAGAPSNRAAFDGVYRMHTKYGDDPSDPTPVPENYGDYIFVLDRGRLAYTQQYRGACTWGYGTYAVKGGEMFWTFTDGGGIAPTGATNKPGEHFRYRWSRYRDTLVLLPVEEKTLPENEVSPTNFRVKPWQLVTREPSRGYFAQKCSPPKNALR